MSPSSASGSESGSGFFSVTCFSAWKDVLETEKLLDAYRRAMVINEQRGMLGRLQLALLR